MTGILRQQSKIFAENAPIRLVTAFRTAGDNPTQSKTPDVIQNETYSVGWINADNTGNLIPYAEDMNGVLYTLSYNTSYLFEKGMPEYSPEQTYYENSFCQYGGYLYRCKVDETLNILPTNTNYWDKIETEAYSATNIGTGEGFYASTIGTQFRFKTLIAADDSVVVDSGDDYVSIRAVAATPDINATSPLSYNAGTISIQAANSSQGGYLTAADWASFNSKLSGTIFSSNNTWTGTNSFSDLLPRANATYSLGSSSIAWHEIYANNITSNSSDHITIGNVNSNNTLLVGDQSSALPNSWGVYPATDSNSVSYLGSSTYRWDYGYIDLIYASSVRSTAYYFGSNSLASYSVLFGHNGTSYVSVADVIGYSSDVSGLKIVPEINNTCALGTSSHYWKEAYIKTIHSDSIPAAANNATLKLQLAGTDISGGTFTADASVDKTINIAAVPLSGGTMTGALTMSANILPSGSRYLGSTSARWANVYASAVDCTGTVTGAFSVTTTAPATQKNNTFYNVTNNVVRFTGGIPNNSGGGFTPSDDNKLYLGASDKRWTAVYAAGGVITTSDVTKKANIVGLDSGLKIINSLPVYSYTWKENATSIVYGFIAQEAISIAPELVEVPENYKEGDGTLGIYTNNVLFLAVKAIQELSAKVEDLQQQLMELKK